MTTTQAIVDPDAQLEKLGLTLPPAPKPVASYIPSVRTGNLLFISGQIPVRDGKPVATGKVGKDVTLAAAQEAARVCVLNGLAIAKDALGGLKKIRKVVRVVAHVAAAPGFTDVHVVANGASDLLAQILGEKGRHSRLALGAAELPLNVPFELDLILEVD
jgi:enamine deaminase RidA (YjgF/YER057c/UK114 family)